MNVLISPISLLLPTSHITADPDVLDINYVTNDVTLFQSDFDSPTHLQNLVAESWNHAVLDSGASRTVCGQVWLNAYVACLNVDDKSRVSYSNSSSIFRFEDGRKVPATSTACIPAHIDNQQLFIDTDVVDEDIPLLLSRPSMKKANMHINLEDDTVQTLYGTLSDPRTLNDPELNYICRNP